MILVMMRYSPGFSQVNIPEVVMLPSVTLLIPYDVLISLKYIFGFRPPVRKPPHAVKPTEMTTIKI
jgi:hypothetical protein